MSTGPKQQLFQEFARIGRALGNAGRIEILEHLGQMEQSVEQLARLCGLSVANTSRHLQCLRQVGLVRTRREGKFVFYTLSDGETVQMMQALFRIGERNLAEVDGVLNGYFRARDEMEPVAREDLLGRARRGEVIVLDVRPAAEFDAGHVPGALNVPLAELEARLAELSGGEEIVAYCRGAYCVLSFEAVAMLRARGIAARRLEDGLPEWRAAGLPVEVGGSV